MTHYKSNAEMLKDVYDYDEQAIRVVPHASQQYEIAVSHTEDDTVGTVAVQQVLEAGDHSCVGMRRVCLYAVAGATVQISPSESGEDFITVAVVGMNGMSPITDICAVRMRITSGKAVVQG